MNKSQIRFARTLAATWKVLRDPVLTNIYMRKWKRQRKIGGTIYGFVFREMYKGAWWSFEEEHGKWAVGYIPLENGRPMRPLPSALPKAEALFLRDIYPTDKGREKTEKS